ncbi:hypothetical protein C7M84_003966 [Penaeus vannamei]|uniref:Uncharacterized protein n=1 Tax=Penaeus vannamei TaxID=6689 RepID=A0A423TLS0_PENVA|nr:hypothetical protein C7M84_003966 [Penaeus vannamei]
MSEEENSASREESESKHRKGDIAVSLNAMLLFDFRRRVRFPCTRIAVDFPCHEDSPVETPSIPLSRGFPVETRPIPLSRGFAVESGPIPLSRGFPDSLSRRPIPSFPVESTRIPCRDASDSLVTRIPCRDASDSLVTRIPCRDASDSLVTRIRETIPLSRGFLSRRVRFPCTGFCRDGSIPCHEDSCRDASDSLVTRIPFRRFPCTRIPETRPIPLSRGFPARRVRFPCHQDSLFLSRRVRFPCHEDSLRDASIPLPRGFPVETRRFPRIPIVTRIPCRDASIPFVTRIPCRDASDSLVTRGSPCHETLSAFRSCQFACRDASDSLVTRIPCRDASIPLSFAVETRPIPCHEDSLSRRVRFPCHEDSLSRRVTPCSIPLPRGFPVETRHFPCHPEDSLRFVTRIRRPIPCPCRDGVTRIPCRDASRFPCHEDSLRDASDSLVTRIPCRDASDSLVTRIPCRDASDSLVTRIPCRDASDSLVTGFPVETLRFPCHEIRRDASDSLVTGFPVETRPIPLSRGFRLILVTRIPCRDASDSLVTRIPCRDASDSLVTRIPCRDASFP